MQSSHNRHHVNAVRRVASLKPDQVAKKRAIDRDNQRHYRAKTKNHIKALEQKVAELTSRLQTAEALLVQAPQPGCTAMVNTATGDKHWAATPIPSRNGIAHEARAQPSSRPLDVSASNQTIHGVSLTQQDSSGFDLIGSIDLAQWLHDPFGLADSAGLSLAPCTYIPLGMPEHTGASWALTSIHDGSDLDTLQPWNLVPLHITASCKLDEVITETVKTWRQKAFETGQEDTELSEPVFPTISSLLNPSPFDGSAVGTSNSKQHRSQRAVPTKSFTEIVTAQTFRTPLVTCPERLAFMYNLSHLLRWLICRSKESFDSMPEFLRPTKLQTSVPHPPWVDMITFPGARDDIIRHMDWSIFPTLRHQLSTFSVNWPYPISTVAIWAPGSKNLMLNPAFEAHVRELASWTVEPEAADTFPFLKPYVKNALNTVNLIN